MSRRTSFGTCRCIVAYVVLPGCSSMKAAILPSSCGLTAYCIFSLEVPRDIPFYTDSFFNHPCSSSQSDITCSFVWVISTMSIKLLNCIPMMKSEFFTPRISLHGMQTWILAAHFHEGRNQVFHWFHAYHLWHVLSMPLPNQVRGLGHQEDRHRYANRCRCRCYHECHQCLLQVSSSSCVPMTSKDPSFFVLFGAMRCGSALQRISQGRRTCKPLYIPVLKRGFIPHSQLHREYLLLSSPKDYIQGSTWKYHIW